MMQIKISFQINDDKFLMWAKMITHGMKPICLAFRVKPISESMEQKIIRQFSDMRTIS